MRYLSAGEFPEWKLYIQTMEVEDELKFDFDPLDASKIFPEDQFPLQPVGRMVLDRNIDNFFNEQEMVAFNPGVTPPGLLLTPEHSVPQCVCGFLPNPVILCCVPPPPPPQPASPACLIRLTMLCIAVQLAVLIAQHKVQLALLCLCNYLSYSMLPGNQVT